MGSDGAANTAAPSLWCRAARTWHFHAAMEECGAGLHQGYGTLRPQSVTLAQSGTPVGERIESASVGTATPQSAPSESDRDSLYLGAQNRTARRSRRCASRRRCLPLEADSGAALNYSTPGLALEPCPAASLTGGFDRILQIGGSCHEHPLSSHRISLVQGRGCLDHPSMVIAARSSGADESSFWARPGPQRFCFGRGASIAAPRGLMPVGVAWRHGCFT